MKKLFIILWNIMMVTSNSVLATELNIKVSNIEVKHGGSLTVLIFGKDGFPNVHNKALYTQTKQNLQKEMTFRFNVNLEELAIKIHHDENSDGKVTKNWTGIIPKEGLGFSNKKN